MESLIGLISAESLIFLKVAGFHAVVPRHPDGGISFLRQNS